jgi:hypothetical protein
LRELIQSKTKLDGATVELAHFGFNQGISEELKQDLIARGAIFEDIPGQESPTSISVGKR